MISLPQALAEGSNGISDSQRQRRWRRTQHRHRRLLPSRRKRPRRRAAERG
jgi:hypothetical protein